MVGGRGRVVGSCMGNNRSSVGNGVVGDSVDGGNMVLHDRLVVGSAMVGDSVGGVVHGGHVSCVVGNGGGVGNHGGGVGNDGRSGDLVVDEGSH